MRYESGSKKLFGIAIPLPSIITDKGWRIGEYPDLVPFAKLALKLDAKLIQLLPLNDTGSQSSPYSALSAFALHPLYIRASDLPESVNALNTLKKLADFAKLAVKGERYSYQSCYSIKMPALREIYNASIQLILADEGLKAFIKQNQWIKTYAVFMRLKKENKEKSWKDWPLFNKPSAEGIETLWIDPAYKEEQLFYAWLQYRAHEQFSLAANSVHKMGIELLGDLPILMNEDSADVWADRENFITCMKAGAPPDMYSDSGQNWGFPLYNWASMAESGHKFWKARIAQAASYYSAYRIDHVLGFFRIWALNEKEESGKLGRYIPGLLLEKDDFFDLGFSEERLRWLSEPHITLKELNEKFGNVQALVNIALDKIGNEELYLFKKSIEGEEDISALPLDTESKTFLKSCWHNRAFLKIQDNNKKPSYAPVWTMENSKAWHSLSGEEQNSIKKLIDEKKIPVEEGWAEQGRALLSMLKQSSEMLPCAEDLGAVPDCVPQVLAELDIPGLRVPRWMRRWKELGQPFVNFYEYDELSLCTPSVHDTSTLRAWWDLEEGKNEFIKILDSGEELSLDAMDTKTQALVIKAMAACSSRLFVVQLQDLLDLADCYRSENPSSDRINVPGTMNDFNWTWKMPVTVDKLFSDEAWCKLVFKFAKR